jgi:hypothetical protein
VLSNVGSINPNAVEYKPSHVPSFLFNNKSTDNKLLLGGSGKENKFFFENDAMLDTFNYDGELNAALMRANNNEFGLDKQEWKAVTKPVNSNNNNFEKNSVKNLNFDSKSENQTTDYLSSFHIEQHHPTVEQHVKTISMFDMQHSKNNNSNNRKKYVSASTTNNKESFKIENENSLNTSDSNNNINLDSSSHDINEVALQSNFTFLDDDANEK